MYKFETVIGSQEEKPAEIDTTSSQYVVYIRKNIQEYHHTDDQDITFDGWKYEECVVPNNDYLADFVKQLVEENQELKTQNEALKSKVEELQNKVTEDNLTIMMGMTETFETLIADKGV